MGAGSQFKADSKQHDCLLLKLEVLSIPKYYLRDVPEPYWPGTETFQAIPESGTLWHMSTWLVLSLKLLFADKSSLEECNLAKTCV